MLKWLCVADVTAHIAMAACVIAAMHFGHGWPVIFFMLIPFTASLTLQSEARPKAGDSVKSGV